MHVKINHISMINLHIYLNFIKFGDKSSFLQAKLNFS